MLVVSLRQRKRPSKVLSVCPSAQLVSHGAELMPCSNSHPSKQVSLFLPVRLYINYATNSLRALNKVCRCRKSKYATTVTLRSCCPHNNHRHYTNLGISKILHCNQHTRQIKNIIYTCIYIYNDVSGNRNKTNIQPIHRSPTRIQKPLLYIYNLTAESLSIPLLHFSLSSHF